MEQYLPWGVAIASLATNFGVLRIVFMKRNGENSGSLRRREEDYVTKDFCNERKANFDNQFKSVHEKLDGILDRLDGRHKK